MVMNVPATPGISSDNRMKHGKLMKQVMKEKEKTLKSMKK